jgi:hypothetical protein
MNLESCPSCGLKKRVPDREIGLGPCAAPVVPAATEPLDRVMNWLAGVLLVAGTVAVVILQAHPPR